MALLILHPQPAAAVNNPRFGDLINSLKAEIGDHRVGVYVIPMDNPSDAFGVDEDAQVPSASAWKGGGIVYFFEHTDPKVWANVPIDYWVHENILRVPPQYRKDWLPYSKILHDVYIMAVFSGNHEAGNVLAYVYHNMPTPRPKNPIIAFNDWSINNVGMTPESGMRLWMAGGTWSAGYRDARYDHRQFFPGDTLPLYDVTYSARDFAQFFYHLATSGKKLGYYDKAVELLSIRNKVISLIEACPETAPSTGMITATKDGYFRPDSPESHHHDVDNDSGLLIFPDGATYIVSFTAFDAHALGKQVTCETVRAIVADHEQHSSF